MTDLIAAADRIERLHGVDEVWCTALDALRHRGIEYVIYLTVDLDGSDPFLLTTHPEIYRNTPPEQDPFLVHCCHSFAITRTGVEFASEHADLPASVHDFVRQASETGFRSGLGIPTRLVGSDRCGGFNLGTPLRRDDFLRRIAPGSEALRHFCLVVHRRIEELVALKPAEAPSALDHLTRRERQLILLVAEGHSRKECARLCGISPHTAAEYIQSAYRKLGVHGRVEVARLVAARAGPAAG